MKIKESCNQCGGSGSITRQIKKGDIMTPRDGSGMPRGLHHVLWNGHGRRDLYLPPAEAFKPIRVLRVEGDMLAVVPLHWDDAEIQRKEMLDQNIGPALTWIPDADNDIFWIYAPHCHLGLANATEAK